MLLSGNHEAIAAWRREQAVELTRKWVAQGRVPAWVRDGVLEAEIDTQLIAEYAARGDKDVAMLKFERDCAEVVYDNAKEAVNVYKRQIDVLREQIEREWSKA